MGKHTSVRGDVVRRIEAAKAERNTPAIEALHTLLTRGVSPASVSLILIVNEKTVRRWISGVPPRPGDLTRLQQLAAKAVELGWEGDPEKGWGRTQAEVVAALSAPR